jgi:hypothetical protein
MQAEAFAVSTFIGRVSMRASFYEGQLSKEEIEYGLITIKEFFRINR